MSFKVHYPSETRSRTRELVDTILAAIAIALGVADTVLSLMRVIDASQGSMLLLIGLAYLLLRSRKKGKR